MIQSLVSLTGYRLLLLAAAFLFSTGGAAIKACSLTSWQIACFRSGIAALSVALLLPEARRIWRWRIFIVGVAYAGTLIFFVLANKLTTSAQAIFLQATSPLYLLLLAPLVLHERIRRSQLLMMCVVAAGALLLLFGEQRVAATAPDPLRGNWLGVLSGVSWALTLTGFRWMGKHGGDLESPVAVVVTGNIIAFFACLPMALPVHSATPVDVGVLLYLGIVQLGLGCLLLTRAARHVPAVEAATLLLLEPVLNPLWTWLLQGERVSTTTLCGAALIVCALSTLTLYQGRRGRRDLSPS
jgi:drug/metabolite transporter (DMT)-like permease